ncbi:MAG: hypothetical protein NT025_07150 [bacterium]|nr:hypothetical protein [bacterium]
MKHVNVLLIMAVGLALWLVGCETKNPGSPKPNQRPAVELSVAPQDGDTVEHNKHLGWWGNDADGQVVGYYLLVDGVRISFTTATDTTIAFAAPVTEQIYAHTFAVLAVDNEGLLSDTAQREFYVINWAPTASFDAAGSIGEGATVGHAFRVTVQAKDTNASFSYYDLSLDDSLSGWMGWRRDSMYLFAGPEIIADSANFPEGVHGIPNTALTAGPHTLFARVKDAGGAESPIISLHFTVADGFRPGMDTTVTATYGADRFYADGSVYLSTRTGVETRVEFSASAAAYNGEINAYRWRLGDGEWSNWSADPVVSMTDAEPKDYDFSFMARDAAGAYSDTLLYFIRIVTQSLTDDVIVVDETADGNGNPGSPNDAQADQFYANVMQGWKTFQIDYATHKVGQTSYVSPYDVRNAGVILWHGDDKANLQLGNNTRILGEFLDRGGRLIISGWDVLGGWSGTADSVEFSSSSFGRKYLRLYEGRRDTARTTLGFDGSGEFPGCRFDASKLPVSYHGQLLKCWTFQPSGECLILGRMVVSDSLTSPFQGRPTAYLYYQSFRVAVFGVPLYFCVESEVHALMEAVMPWMLQGLQ